MLYFCIGMLFFIPILSSSYYYYCFFLLQVLYHVPLLVKKNNFSPFCQWFVPQTCQKPITLNSKFVSFSGCGDPLSLAESEYDSLNANTFEKITHPQRPETEPNSTRYICVQCGDKEVTIFRETTV